MLISIQYFVNAVYKYIFANEALKIWIWLKRKSCQVNCYNWGEKRPGKAEIDKFGGGQIKKKN